MEPTTALAETGGLDEADKILTDAATGAGPEDDVQALRQLQVRKTVYKITKRPYSRKCRS